ncbi:MAG: ABC transporter permease [Desemzia incerta]|uniref:ABC transporter permease n=1 Tax=Desemzia incerta TaxID=82801 RepID=UPI003314567C
MNLIKLEMKKIDLSPYFLAAIIIPIAALAMVELMAYAPRIDPSFSAADSEMMTYEFLYFTSFIVNVAGFACLGTALLGKVIMESYNDNYIYLTLSYPVSRKKILFAKIIFCVVFSGLGVFIGLFLTNGLFFISESVFPLVQDTLSFSQFIRQLPLLVIAGVLVSSVSLISLMIGWWKKSLSLAIVAAVVLCSILSNLVMAGGQGIVIVTSLFLLVISLLVTVTMTRKVARLEA